MKENNSKTEKLFALSENDFKVLKECSSEILKKKSSRYFLGKHANHKIILFNPLTYILGPLMYLYQNEISPQIGGSCLYHPSCSEFSKKSIEEFGWIKGVALSADRLCRCTFSGLMEVDYVVVDPGTGRFVDNPALYRFNRK